MTVVFTWEVKPGREAEFRTGATTAVVRFADTAAPDRRLASPARVAREERVRPFGHSVRPKLTTAGLDGRPLPLRTLVFPVARAPLLRAPSCPGSAG
ncbi:hypothetical protein ADL02_00275 [Streptomyces sp. NRRL WC-3723]|nr:hypothetical protein ADL02_00275 [Streptomyces sp. NRRL WC-3723]